MSLQVSLCIIFSAKTLTYQLQYEVSLTVYSYKDNSKFVLTKSKLVRGFR